MANTHEHHKKAAERHEHAAKHHHEAAKHHEAGDHVKAAHHVHAAHGHATHAPRARRQPQGLVSGIRGRLGDRPAICY